MKRIAIFCVIYHSYQEAEHYLASIDKAVEKAAGAVSLDVFVADNTTTNPQPITYQASNFKLQSSNSRENLGYFGGIKHAMQEVDVEAYDYAIISNVDLTMDEEFFVKLAAYECPEDTGWIAPQIWSDLEGRDRNPQVMKRYSLRKLKLLSVLHHHPYVWLLYHKTFYRKKKFQRHPAGQIYAGHGSIIILTKAYFKRCGKIDYPMFLFCEELYLAEECQQAGLKVQYVPDIKITDKEHVSTGLMKLRFFSRLNYEAVQYIIHRYYT